MSYESVVTDDFTVESSRESAEDMTATFAPPEESVETPVEETPAVEEAKVEAAPVEPEDPLIARNADGSFKQKAKKGSIHELRQNIAKATWEREETKREADKYKAELDRLKAERAPAPVQQPAAPVSDTFPDFVAWEAQNSGKPYEAYIDARADWKFDQRQIAEHQQAAERQQVSAIERVNTAGLSAHPDFTDKLNAMVAAKLQFPPLLTDLILSEDSGPALAYEYATHLDDLRRLSALPVAQAALAIGKTLARLEAPHSGSASIAPVLSKANPPIQPVAGSQTRDTDVPDDDEPLEAHILRYNKLDRKAGR